MYNFVDHTADVAFEIYAKDLNELLRDAALAFYEAFVFTEKIEDKIQKEIEIEENSVDYLLYNWLNEILYLFDVEHFGGKRVDAEVTDGRAKGRIYGDILDPQKIKLEPKAITLHNFRVEKRNEGYYAYVVVDI